MPHVQEDEELQLGHIYFIMPISKLYKILTLQELCLLAIKASVALDNKCSSQMKKGGGGGGGRTTSFDGRRKESKDLTSLSLDKLIGNLKVYEMIIKKDSKTVKAKVERKSLPLKAKKELSEEECSTSGSEDEEYGDPNHLIGECPKPPKDKNQRAFVGGSWSDSGEEDDGKVKDETCLVAHASNEVNSGPLLEFQRTGNRNTTLLQTLDLAVHDLDRFFDEVQFVVTLDFIQCLDTTFDLNYFLGCLVDDLWASELSISNLSSADR
uniref:UBN2 domain-containing protein n=1 Tax=Tanacetum cinerariifolium TaxID=118510 RepID=A0A699GRF4_TANCI|nr:hypothetical protein [Tanacetum cinerariifolium]